MEIALLLAFVVVVVVVVTIVSLTVRARQVGASGGGAAPAADAPYNTLAVVAFVLAFFVSIAAVVCGHIALRDIARRGERGRGLAIASLWIGYVSIAASITAGIIAVVVVLTAR